MLQQRARSLAEITDRRGKSFAVEGARRVQKPRALHGISARTGLLSFYENRTLVFGAMERVSERHQKRNLAGPESRESQHCPCSRSLAIHLAPGRAGVGGGEEKKRGKKNKYVCAFVCACVCDISKVSQVFVVKTNQ
jgi:hypothetical protein